MSWPLRVPDASSSGDRWGAPRWGTGNRRTPEEQRSPPPGLFRRAAAPREGNLHGTNSRTGTWAAIRGKSSSAVNTSFRFWMATVAIMRSGMPMPRTPFVTRRCREDPAHPRRAGQVPAARSHRSAFRSTSRRILPRRSRSCSILAAFTSCWSAMTTVMVLVRARQARCARSSRPSGRSRVVRMGGLLSHGSYACRCINIIRIRDASSTMAPPGGRRGARAGRAVVAGKLDQVGHAALRSALDMCLGI